MRCPPSKGVAILACLAGLGCGRAGDSAGTLVDAWGKRGLLPGDFVKPRAIAINDRDELFTVDMRALIQVHSLDGKYLRGWSTPTHQFGRPSGLCLDRDGNLVVADSHYHRILVYDRNGTLLRALGGDEGPGPLVGRFGYIGDVAEDSQGNLYVAESQVHERITKLRPDGEILAEWGGRGAEPGQFSRIRALAVDSQDRLYVADACNHRVQVFDADGRLLRVIGKPGTGDGELDYPYDVAIGPKGDLFVCEYGNNRIQRFTLEGVSLGKWGTAGRREGGLWNPWGVGVDRKGTVYVVDSNNHRIQKVQF